MSMQTFLNILPTFLQTAVDFSEIPTYLPFVYVECERPHMNLWIKIPNVVPKIGFKIRSFQIMIEAYKSNYLFGACVCSRGLLKLELSDQPASANVALVDAKPYRCHIQLRFVSSLASSNYIILFKWRLKLAVMLPHFEA